MGGRSAAVEEVVRWLEAELRSGRFRVGDGFPSERALSQRLRVGRGVVREAKALLCGRGVLVQDRLRCRFARPDGAALFRDWISSVTAADDGERARRTREALELWRWVLPESTAIAVRRASSERLEILAGHVADLEFGISLRLPAPQIADSHEALMARAAEVARQPVLVALSFGLAEAMRALPIWEAAVAERAAWKTALEEVSELIRARNASRARRVLRRHLRWFELRTRNAVGVFPVAG